MKSNTKDDNNSLADFTFSLSIEGNNASQTYIFQGVSNAESIDVTSKKYSNLIIKRGIIAVNSELASWCSDTVGGGLGNSISTKTINLSLNTKEGHSLKSWKYINAWPVKYSVSDIPTVSGQIIIEAIEFAYSEIQ